MRADAKRNRDKLIEVAHVVFKEQGMNAPLDEIARRAGVGPGTLYRHFPTRENLHDAVMQAWVDRVNVQADKALAHEGGAHERLVAWFEEYVELLTQHKGAAARITASLGDENSPIKTKCMVYKDATERVLENLREEGALRDGVDGIQVCRLVGGVATIADQAELDDDAIRPMLEVVADGLLA
ncbi:TetR/AcrR family transcriptional regulator [Nocardioides sp. KR10-350]|uniref:TetR/AcrR family transcriptional regulator n=1 Tax=Nocardioides cheoyonin TaxID=3156615 RepID=UPI0032B4E3AB